MERRDGKTGPEELLATAHASGYAVALSHTLADKGVEIEQLTVDTVAALEEAAGGFRISSVDLLDVSGEVVSGMNQEEFGKAVGQAPKHQPLRGVPLCRASGARDGRCNSVLLLVAES